MRTSGQKIHHVILDITYTAYCNGAIGGCYQKPGSSGLSSDFWSYSLSKQVEAANLEQVKVLVPWVSEITISPVVLSEQVLHPTLQVLFQNVYCLP